MNRCLRCADALLEAAWQNPPRWNFCPGCGLPLRMPCPMCGEPTSLRDAESGGAVLQCSNGDLLKSCPSCFKLYPIDAERCDQPHCVNQALNAPPSSWADAHGGVNRRRLIRRERREPSLPDNIDPHPRGGVGVLRLPANAGDSLLSAYGSLYFDYDPRVVRHTKIAPAPGGGLSTHPDLDSVRGAPLYPVPHIATALALHSGYLAVLGQPPAPTTLDEWDEDVTAPTQIRLATLLHAGSLSQITQLPAPGVDNQIVADNLWWHFGVNGVHVYKLRNPTTPYATLADRDLSNALPPVRLKSGVVWLVLCTGQWLVLTVRKGTVRILHEGSLAESAEGEALSGKANFACLGGDLSGSDKAFAALAGTVIRATQNGPQGALVVYKLADLLGEASPPVGDFRSLDFEPLPTGACDEKMVYLVPQASATVRPFQLVAPTLDVPSITLPDTHQLSELVRIEDKGAIRLMGLTRDGQFQLFADSGARELYATNWTSGQSVHTWCPWGSNSLAVITNEIDDANGQPYRLLRYLPRSLDELERKESA